ncbi:hypothetical protein EVAR_53498_1 [Eumeta japonica]|uniref:Uncharacterized protein n=1 Tax=Eumeta variegata TaxID=151549 RepID=A0A4C1Y7F8_EUMVA|nr:hypothetical protein EVAR_53498_1 [Eumeta japonica]
MNLHAAPARAEPPAEASVQRSPTLPSSPPLYAHLRRCEAFVNNFTAAEFRALYCTKATAARAEVAPLAATACSSRLIERCRNFVYAMNKHMHRMVLLISGGRADDGNRRRGRGGTAPRSTPHAIRTRACTETPHLFAEPKGLTDPPDTAAPLTLPEAGRRAGLKIDIDIGAPRPRGAPDAARAATGPGNDGIVRRAPPDDKCRKRIYKQDYLSKFYNALTNNQTFKSSDKSDTASSHRELIHVITAVRGDRGT